MAKRRQSELDLQEQKVHAAIARVTSDVASVSDAVKQIPVTWSSDSISGYVSDQARGWASRAGADAAARWADTWAALKSRLGRRSNPAAGGLEVDFSDI
jgi:hypothetical protein